MTGVDPHVLVRAASVYLSAAVTLGVVWWRRPARRVWVAVLLACAWNVPSLLAANILAVDRGWWRFDADGGTLLGIPVDLWLAWAWMWGALPLLLAPRLPLRVLTLAALGVDLVVMPLAAPVVHLGPQWLAGEAVCLIVAFVPGQLLARWTLEQRHLAGRATLQMLAVAGLAGLVLPAIAIQGSGGTWVSPLSRSAWVLSLWAQVLALPAVIGLSALQEFVERGQGTPVPFDPPQRLVTSGLYAYVRNPMQIAATLVLGLLGLALGNLWVSSAAVMSHLYAAGLASWDESDDMTARHGEAWTVYRRAVRDWQPRWRPWYPPDAPPARLYVAGSCDMCREVGRWFSRRGPLHLQIEPAETHPSGALRRITYESGDGTYSASGIVAVARALEHLHLGWALAGSVVRLPGVAPMVQLLVDASGGQARAIAAPSACVATGAAASRAPSTLPQ